MEIPRRHMSIDCKVRCSPRRVAIAEKITTSITVIAIALATHGRMVLNPGISQGLLFDWALPLLSHPEGSATGGGTKHVGSIYWVLTALQEGLLHCDDRTVARYGNTIFDACQSLLESDDLSVHLLAPILNVLMQARTPVRSANPPV
jgi:hypothetical protein